METRRLELVRLEKWLGFVLMTFLILLPVVFVLQGVFAKDLIDKGFWYFLGAGISITPIILLKSVLKLK